MALRFRFPWGSLLTAAGYAIVAVALAHAVLTDFHGHLQLRALLNGAVWGTLLGALAYAFYDNVALGGVLALAMMLNLLLAAAVGVAIPWLRARFGRDPAVGSSVLITACTDSGGFFIFLGLATLFLI